jgi:hypothetical protein
VSHKERNYKVNANEKLREAVKNVDVAKEQLAACREAVTAAETSLGTAKENLARVIAARGSRGKRIVIGKRCFMLQESGSVVVESTADDLDIVG